MNRFDYFRASDINEAVQARAADTAARFIAGGTNLIDLMKENVARPTRLIDITDLPLRAVTRLDGGGLRLGALSTNADVAYHPDVEANYPLLSSAILAGASAQLRNVATTGGNLLQRTRCYYFYDTATACNKREPGSGCPALQGVNRMHAILGASAACIATHPSDMCVALAALAATVHVTGVNGDRVIPFEAFHRLPGDKPEIDTTLKDDEIITSVDLPSKTFMDHYTYLKLRDRASYAFALVSVAVALDLDGPAVTQARLALGGVAHKPWRDTNAEAFMKGQTAGERLFRDVADAVLRHAKGYGHNAFKIELARKAIVRALSQAAAGTPQLQANKRIQ
jgi:xanthine dehydrogenase YagS FAD-binding subunit